MDSRSTNLDHLLYIPEINRSQHKRRVHKGDSSDDEDEKEYYEKDVEKAINWSPRHIVRRTLASRLISRLAVLICIYFALSSLYRRVNRSRSTLSDVLDPNAVDWSKFAYVQYATSLHYLCNSVMLFESLHRMGSKASRVIMYPDTWEVSVDLKSFESKLLLKLQDEYNVNLMPVDVLRSDGVGDWWEESFTKLRGFGLKDYKRVLNLDSDSTLLKVRGCLSLPSLIALQCAHPVMIRKPSWIEPPLTFL